MPRPDADTLFAANLRRILEYPEIEERFRRMEADTTDRIVAATDDEERLELCRYLKVLRDFRKGQASFKSMRVEAEERRKANERSAA